MAISKVTLSALLEGWAATASHSYERGVISAQRLFATAVPTRFRVGGIGFVERDRSEIWDPLIKYLDGEGYGFVGANDVAGSKAPYDVRLGSLGAISTAYVAAGRMDPTTFFFVTYVLQMAQKVRVSKLLGKHSQFEYFFLRQCITHGYVPLLICVGESYKPLQRLILEMAEQGFIAPEDVALVQFVPDMESATKSLAVQAQIWLETVDPRDLEKARKHEPLEDLVKTTVYQDAFKRAVTDVYFPDLIRFADLLETRPRVAGFGSHLVGCVGEGREFGFRCAKGGYDVVTGGGPKTMEEMADGARQASEEMRSAMAVLTSPKAISMYLVLPDEQASAIQVDFAFHNAHFPKRLDGFGAMAPFFVSKRKGGLGTIFEDAYVLYTASRMLRPNCAEHDRFANVGSRRGGFVPRLIAIGDLYRTVVQMFAESDHMTEAERNLLVVVPNLDAMERELNVERDRWVRALRSIGLEPVSAHHNAELAANVA